MAIEQMKLVRNNGKIMDLYKSIPDTLQLVLPEGTVIPDHIDPEVLYRYMNSLPIDTMNRFYESWPKKEKKGSKFKIRWLSKVIDETIYKHMQFIASEYELAASHHVYSYKKGMKTADCASLFVNMTSIVALDIKDFYYSITGKMVEEMYFEYMKFLYTSKFKQGGAAFKTDEWRQRCIAKMFSIMLMAKDIRPDNIRFNGDTVLLQGTPHAGMIANAVLFALDETLKSYCDQVDMVYARYSDNFYIGCKDDKIDQEFVDNVIALIENFEIGGIKNFKIKTEKLKIMNYYTHQRVLGIVVNSKMNISSFTEDIINARIARYSKYLNEQYTGQCIRWNRDTNLGTIKTRKVLAAKMRKETRDLKGLISYLGSFNRDKYNKYSRYVDFLEKRSQIMSVVERRKVAVFPYDRSSDEHRLVLDAPPGSVDTSVIPSPYASFYERRFLILDITDPEAVLIPFASQFDNGFLGISYHDTYRDRTLLFVPMTLHSKYIALADEIMISNDDDIHNINRSPYRTLLPASSVSPIYKAISVIGTMNYAFTDTPNLDVRLKSVLVYNRENPLGYVNFEGYTMALRSFFTTECNVCLVKNELDGPAVLYSNLWSLRKAYLKNEVTMVEFKS